MSEKSWERRTLMSYGSNFRIDVNNPQTTVGGEDVYNIYGITDEEDVCLMGLQQNGIFRIYNNKTVEIVGGQKTSENGVDIVISGKNGDVIINADKNGRIRIRGKNVIIQADEDVDISGGRNVNIKAGSGRVLIGGNTLEKAGLKGNLLDPEQQWAWRVFEGTGLPGGEFSSLLSPFGGITDIATQLVANPASFGQVLTSAVTDSITGAVGGVLGDTVGDISSIADLASGIAGGDILSNVSGLTNVASQFGADIPDINLGGGFNIDDLGDLI